MVMSHGEGSDLAHGAEVELKLGFQCLLPIAVGSCVDETEAVVDPSLLAVLDAHSATSSAM